MIHSLFGTNRPVVMVLLIIPAIAILIASSYQEQVGFFQLSGPLSDLLEQALSGYPIWRRVIGMIVILANAFLLNKIYNQHDFATNENHFPAIIYLILCSLSFNAIELHPALLASFFVLLSLRRLLTTYRATSVLSIGFDAALLMSIAVLFFPPTFLLLPLIWITFLQERTFNLREWLAPFSAVVFLAFYLASYIYLQGYQFDPSEFFSTETRNANPVFAELHWTSIATYAFISFITLLGLLSLIRNISQSTLRKKSTKYIMLWLTFLIVLLSVYTLFLPTDTFEAYPLLCIPASVYLGFLFSKKEKRKLRIGLFYAWLIISIVFIVFAN